MVEILSSLSTALATVKKIKEVSDKIRDADLKNLIGDLSLELAEIKVKLAELMQENTELKDKIRGLEKAEADPCPKCKRRTFELDGSHRHPTFGDMGVIVRVYRCTSCGFQENQMITPK